MGSSNQPLTPSIGSVNVNNGLAITRDGITHNSLVVSGTNFGTTTSITLCDPTKELYDASNCIFNSASGNMEGFFTANSNNLTGLQGLALCPKQAAPTDTPSGGDPRPTRKDAAVLLCLTVTAANTSGGNTACSTPHYIPITAL